MSAVDVKKLQAIIDSTRPILTRLQESEALLTPQGLMWVTVVNCDLILVHLCNRAGLGVNQHEVHRLGFRVRKVGFHSHELRPWVFELPDEPADAQKHLAFNQKLIDNSSGLLAPRTGKENYISVGGGHMAQFVKALNAGCKTPIAAIADADGILDKQKFLKDGVLAKFAAEGVETTVVHATVDKQVPAYADFVQRALNATNSIQNESSETEIMCAIAEFAAGSSDIDKCTEAAIAGSPPCASYASVLAEFVVAYGGGDGAPVVHDIDAFAQKHAGNLRMGEEFCKQLVALFFGDDTPCPRVRSALILACLISAKSRDGISTLFGRTDLQKLTSKTMRPKVIALEKEFETAESMAKGLVNTGAIDVDKAKECNMFFRVRSITHLMAKTSETLLSETWSSLEAITAKLYKDLGASPAEEQKEEPKPKEKVLLTLEACSDIRVTARDHGFAEGVRVRAPSSSQTWEIKKLDFDVELELLEVYKGVGDATKKAKTSPMNLIQKFTIFEGELPKLLSREDVEHCDFHMESEIMLVDKTRVRLFNTLQDYATKHASSHIDQAFFAVGPMSSAALKHIPAEKMLFVPYVPLDKIGRTGTLETGTLCQVGKQKIKMMINSPKLCGFMSVNRMGGPIVWNGWGREFVHPFFWVYGGKRAYVKADATMALKNVTHKGCTFPVMYNVKALEKGDALVLLSVTKKRDASEGPLEVQEDVPAKKAKP